MNHTLPLRASNNLETALTLRELKKTLLRHMPSYKSDLNRGECWKRSVEEAVQDAFNCYSDEMATQRTRYAEQRAERTFREMLGLE